MPGLTPDTKKNVYSVAANEKAYLAVRGHGLERVCYFVKLCEVRFCTISWPIEQAFLNLCIWCNTRVSPFLSTSGDYDSQCARLLPCEERSTEMKVGSEKGTKETHEPEICSCISLFS